MRSVLIPFLFLLAISNSAQGQFFAGGDGSTDNPWQISTPSQLDSLRYFSRDNFILVNNINMGFDTQNPEGKYWNEGKGFEPIPGSFQEFFGVLDGNGYKIDSLFINRPDEDYVGLFTTILCCKEDTIYDLGLTNAEVTGNNNVGVLAGQNAGYIKRVYTTGDVSGNEHVGGILGISANDFYDSYSEANVSGVNGVGGITGYAISSDFGMLYSFGKVTGEENVGGLVGYISNISSIEDEVYWNIETSGIDSSALGTPLTSDQMRQRSNYVGFNFDSIWEMSDGFTFPFLKANRPKPLPGFIDPFQNGNGTELDPYQISTNTELNQIRFLLEDNFILMNNLNLTFDTQNPEGEFWNGGKGWRPIGTARNPFLGNLDGNNHTITGIKINDTANSNGFFSYNGKYGVIENLNLDSVSVKGYNLPGAITSENFGIISNVSVNGIVNGSGVTGGLVGNNREGGTVTESSMNGTVISEFLLAGGLIGDNRGEVSDSYVIAEVSNINNVGGPPETGGIIGYGFSGNVSNSFFIGTLSSSTVTGGVVGSNLNTTFENVYWDSTATGLINGAGAGNSEGIFALSSEEMQNQNSFENWDFETIWIMSDSLGHPILRHDDTTVNNEVTDHAEFPFTISLSQNYPNPFNPTTTIIFEIPEASKVSLKVYDILGRVVEVIIDEQLNAGVHQSDFNASQLSSGIYFYRLEAGNTSMIKKMMLVK